VASRTDRNDSIPLKIEVLAGSLQTTWRFFRSRRSQRRLQWATPLPRPRCANGLTRADYSRLGIAPVTTALQDAKMAAHVKAAFPYAAALSWSLERSVPGNEAPEKQNVATTTNEAERQQNGLSTSASAFVAGQSDSQAGDGWASIRQAVADGIRKFYPASGAVDTSGTVDISPIRAFIEKNPPEARPTLEQLTTIGVPYKDAQALVVAPPSGDRSASPLVPAASGPESVESDRAHSGPSTPGSALVTERPAPQAGDGWESARQAVADGIGKFYSTPGAVDTSLIRALVARNPPEARPTLDQLTEKGVPHDAAEALVGAPSSTDRSASPAPPSARGSEPVNSDSQPYAGKSYSAGSSGFAPSLCQPSIGGEAGLALPPVRPNAVEAKTGAAAAA